MDGAERIVESGMGKETDACKKKSTYRLSYVSVY